MSILQAQWIGIDWGTTNLRAFLIDRSGSLAAELESDQGMGRLKPEEFEAALVSLIEPWLRAGETIPVIACGMVGARQGWIEAKYRSVPCRLLQEPQLTRADTSDPRIEVFILPGLSQETPADVMRGEETQVAGFLASEPDYCGVVCLPGTHTKWVSVDQGIVGAFQTFMTGELFTLLAQHSILRHSISDGGEDPAAFMLAARKAVQNPESIALTLFGLRATSLLNEPEPQAARAKLSGMIIGHEIGVARSIWQGSPVAIIGTSKLASRYLAVLEAEGADTRLIDTRIATLSGLAIAAKQAGAAAA